MHFSLLDLSTSATLYPTMQDMNCKEEQGRERLNLIKRKHIWIEQWFY